MDKLFYEYLSISVTFISVKHHAIRPSIKKNCLLYPYLPTFNLPTQNFFWHFWKIELIFAPFSSENHDFPIMQQWKKKKIMNIFFPTYLPNQKIQDRGTANKQFFKDDLT